jgi:HlyD family secretion protein
MDPMPQTTELGLGRVDELQLGAAPSRDILPPRKEKGMKRWKKIVLSIVAAAVLIGLVLGGIAWSRKGVVAVQTGKVIRQDLASIVTASGEIKPPSNQWANVNANSFGKITEILVKEGDRVKRGQLLLKTESVQQEADVKAQEAALLTARADASAAEAAVASSSANLKTSQADLAQSRARHNQSKDDFNRAEQLFKDRLIAQQIHDQRGSDYAVAQAGLESAQARVTQARAQVDQATYTRDMAKARVAQSQAQLIRARDLRNKTIYTSPLDGIITSLPVHVGENVVPGIQNQPGSVLFQVSDLSVITAEVKVDETDIVNVKLGQPAEVNIDAIPNKTFKGHVTEIGQSAVSRTTGQTTSQSGAPSEEAKNFKVVVTLDDPPSNVRPGLSTTAKVTTATRQNAVTVPIQALTIRTRRELEETGKDAKDKALAAGPGVSTPVASSKDKEKGKEELQGVFAVRKGRAVFVPVETGIMGATDVEVLKGLEQGEEMVTGSYQVLRTLKNNTKVKVEKNPGDKGPAPPR